VIGHALDHHHEQDPAFIPTAQPAHPPAIQVIANLDRPIKSKELGFHLHSPLRTCMALRPPEVNPPFRSRLLTDRASVRILFGEPNISHFGILSAFWLTARFDIFAEMADI
jgi:hypothetical protein